MPGATQRVIVGYDGSEDSDRALDWAMGYARPRHLTVEAMGCVGDLTYLPERTEQQAMAQVEHWLEKAAVRLREGEAVDGRTTASAGKVVTELLDASNDAELVVVGAQGHGVFGGYVLGSVSQHVTRHAGCPVVVVRGLGDTKNPRIVVGVDGSDAGQKALGFAFDVAESTVATVVAVHGHGMSAVNGPWDVNIAPAVAAEMEASQRLLSEAVAGLRQDFPDVPVELAPVPLPPNRALADASVRASLLVVGTRGRGGFMGLMLGSVSSTVLHHAHCSVAVVR